MGLKPGQTVVKLDTYSIICVPYRLTMNGAVLIASFSSEELSFFQRYVNGLAGLTLIFQPGGTQNPLKIFARCVLRSVSPMKGRESIGLIDVAFKPCPPDLETILIDYFMLMDRLKVEYDDFKGKPISINPDSAKAMGYNNYSMLASEGAQAKVALFALASDSLDFLVPMNGPTLVQGKPMQMKLFFQSYQFTVPGSIASVTTLQNGVQKARASIQFSSELVSIIEQYRFAERFSAKAAQAAPTSQSSAPPGSMKRPAPGPIRGA
ncbi:MAG: hypothetical protein CVV47_05190 [Spirochaetae bacterium HGW-Spirochaetae-3]|nr:MAG: hypothetical protein CVV47_05190 [Spirochaetae bacterium HGW-Spirochaetae-3]